MPCWDLTELFRHRAKTEDNLDNADGIAPASLRYGERIGLVRYFILCFVVTALPCVAVFLFWSLWGWGEQSYNILEEEYSWAVFFGCVAVAIIVGLYLVDFYWPPHLPGKYMVLYDGDRCIGRLILVIGGVALFLASLFAAQSYPTVPVIVTVLCGPILVMSIRALTHPQGPYHRMSRKEVRMLTMEKRVNLLKAIAFEEEDAKMFYSAAAAAFFVSGIVTLVLWIIWYIVLFDDDLSELHDDAVTYLCIASPFFAALSNLMFFVFVFLRVWLSRAAASNDESTHNISLEIIHEGGDDLDQALTDEAILGKHLKDHGVLEQFKNNLSEASQKEFASNNQIYMQQLSNIVKVVGCALLFMVGGGYIAAELVSTASQISQLAVGFLAVFFVTFFTLVILWFRRLGPEVKERLEHLPLWHMADNIRQNNWARAVFLTFILPWAPIFLFISAANQLIRRWRRLYRMIPSNLVASNNSPCPTSTEIAGDSDMSLGGEGEVGEVKATASQATMNTIQTTPEDPHRQDRIFTERVMTALTILQNWDWLDLVVKMYVTGLFFTVYVLSPRLLNVLLAWLISLLQGLDFYVIIVCTFWAGLACFLFPPVPGVPVYLFAGFVISAACHQTDTTDYAPGAPHGFWWGALISVTIGFVLKLAACAMQQKLIGERLGYSLWVRQQVRVHKPMIRSIEAVLRSKGFGVGKIAILCGGPDWPTSVMAGIMKLSLVEMEIGTIPIIFFIAPCSLSGAFYMRKDESEFWDRLASLMIASTLIVNLVLWIAAAWAIQETLENNHWELSKPLEHNVELEWMDYRNAAIRGEYSIKFDRVPKFQKYFLVAGALMECIVGQMFYWVASTFFTEFPVNGDINTLTMVGEDGLIRYPGAVGLVFCVIGIFCYVPYWRWQRSQLGEIRATKLIELRKEEAPWKENFLLEARQARESRRPTLGQGVSSRSTSTRLSGLSGYKPAENERTSATLAEKENKASPVLPPIISVGDATT